MSGTSDHGLDACKDDQLGSGLTCVVGKQPAVHADSRYVDAYDSYAGQKRPTSGNAPGAKRRPSIG
jgi:hypothetical protein